MADNPASAANRGERKRHRGARTNAAVGWLAAATGEGLQAQSSRKISGKGVANERIEAKRRSRATASQHWAASAVKSNRWPELEWNRGSSAACPLRSAGIKLDVG
jgi:hypothetical protein